jgi:phosphatidate cytidylyltransferase
LSGLERRVGTALVYGVVVLAAVFAPPPTFVALVAILATLGYIELHALFKYRPYRPWLVGVVFTVLFVIAHLARTVWTDGLMPMTVALSAAFGVVAILVFVAEGARHRPWPSVAGAVFTLGGALYLGLLFGYLVDLWMADGAATKGYLGTFPVWLAIAFAPTWAADITAYFVGSSIGRRYIAPRISPRKTWEGTVAGFAAAAAVALLIATSAGIKTGPTLLVAALIGPVGFASDLLESAIKRAAGAKDSGTLLPGHGGVLDRIDSLILVAPLVALALALAERMG